MTHPSTLFRETACPPQGEDGSLGKNRPDESDQAEREHFDDDQHVDVLTREIRQRKRGILCDAPFEE